MRVNCNSFRAPFERVCRCLCDGFVMPFWLWGRTTCLLRMRNRCEKISLRKPSETSGNWRCCKGGIWNIFTALYERLFVQLILWWWTITDSWLGGGQHGCCKWVNFKKTQKFHKLICSRFVTMTQKCNSVSEGRTDEIWYTAGDYHGICKHRFQKLFFLV